MSATKMEKVEDVIDNLIARKDYELGEAWRDKESPAAVIPILLRQVPSFDRAYVTAEEVLEKLDIEDTGSISELNFTSKADKPVFMRSGTLFEGKGTQSRAAEESKVYTGSKGRVHARCVHASHGIRTGAKFRTRRESAPLNVTRSLYSGSQGEVWNSVSAYTAYAGPSHSMARHGGMSASARSHSNFQEDSVEDVGLASISSDDLIGNIDSSGYAKDLDQFIRAMPAFETQVGMVVLDQKGVVGIELFDHPDSWKAVSNSVIKKYGEVFTKPSKTPFKLDLDKDVIPQVVDGFLNETKEAVKDSLKDGTVRFNSKVVGEFTRFLGRIIHVVSLRSSNEPRSTSNPRPIPNDFSLSSTLSTSMGREGSRYTMHMSAPPSKSKVLLSMPDDILSSVDTYAKKEHDGNRSKAMAKLAKNGLKARGYD